MTAFRFAGSGRHARSLARRLPIAAACGLALGFGTTAAAQSDAEVAGYLALSYTPIGALAPSPPFLGGTSSASGSRYVLQGRYGRLSPSDGLSNTTIGAGIEFPVGRWSLGGTLAYLSVSCTEEWEDFSDCDSDIMLGGSARTTLLSRPLEGRSPAAHSGRPAGAPGAKTFVIGFETGGGFSPRQGEQAIALSVGVPTGISIENGNMRLLPFLTPGFGYGRLGSTSFAEDAPSRSYASTMLMVGGGLGIQFTESGIGATLGFQKILKTGGSGTALGLTMSWNGPARSR